jgi:hypothetical protein
MAFYADGPRAVTVSGYAVKMAVWRHWTALVVASAVIPVAACSTSATKKPERDLQPLVSLDGWSSVARSDDPFIVDPAAAPACVGPGFRVETADAWVEIDTGLCNWVTLTQGARLAVSEGDELELQLSHYDLDAAAPSQAMLELRFGACKAWSTTIPIPRAAEVSRVPFDSPCALAAGESVLFHLHNHGQNTYQLRDLRVLR